MMKHLTSRAKDIFEIVKIPGNPCRWCVERSEKVGNVSVRKISVLESSASTETRLRF